MIAALILAAAAQPLPALQNQVLNPACRQGQCAWVRVTGIARVGRGRQGELRRITVRRGYSRDSNRAPIRWEPGTRTDHVFCSTARPTYAFTEDGGLIV